MQKSFASITGFVWIRYGRRNNLQRNILRIYKVSFATEASLVDDDYKQCEYRVTNWASSSMNSETDDNKHELLDFLFFLHVPRTGGRTYHHCLLQKMNLSSRECLSSYSQFQFDPSDTKCRLLSSHDDYSVMSKLPKERTSVMTIVRNPIERVFGSYEFSVELSATFLKHDDMASARRMEGDNQTVSRARSGIWPWKYLVTWMEADIRARRDVRELRGQVHVTNDNPYDMEDFLMPLRDYIYDPVVRDLVHNGATFQIAGLTNYSIFEEAHEVRHCVIKYQDLGKYVLDVAKKRLDNMLFVGLTEKHIESASMFANIVGPQVISGIEVSSSDPQVTEKRSAHPFPKVRSTKDHSASPGNLTVEGLIEIYESCASSMKADQSRGWGRSLKRIYNAGKNFTKETRRLVPEEIIEEIAYLNRLDIELHNYAKIIFMKQQERVSKHIPPYSSTPESLCMTTFVSWMAFLSLSVVFIATLLPLLLSRLNRRRIMLSSKVKS